MTPLDETKLVWDKTIKILQGYKKRGTIPWKKKSFFGFKCDMLRKALNREPNWPFYGCPLCEHYFSDPCFQCPLSDVDEKTGEYFNCENKGPYQFYQNAWDNDLDRCIAEAKAFRKYLDEF